MDAEKKETKQKELLEKFKKCFGKIWGILLVLVISVPAWFLGKLVPVVGGPVFSIIIGMCLAPFIKKFAFFQAGIKFTSKKVLQYAVVLLGFGLNLKVIAQTGVKSLPIILSTITTALVVAFVFAKLFKVPSKVATLVGIGSSICGGSAIAAAAPVIEADDKEIAQSISVIFLFNVIAALIFPTIGGWIGLSNEGFALFAGTAINDTSSVTAAASSWDSIHGTGSEVLDGATIVKLTRTLAIIPITLVLAFWQLYQAKKAQKLALAENGEATDVKFTFNFVKIFPWFILFFLLASVLTTFVDLPVALVKALKTTSKFFIVMAMGAIGLNTNLIQLVKTGGKPILEGLCCWICIAAVSLLMQLALGIM